MFIPATGVKLEVAGLDPDTQLTLEQPIGRGFFGDVFKARGDASGNLFAVKFPRLAFGGGDEITAFQNELKAAEEIRHPNVVKVLFAETGSTGTPPFLVMEFVAGGTLASQLEKYRSSEEHVPLQLLRTWTDQLLEAISAINSRMLHRDLKPDNILVDEGALKIGDFGLSKVVGAATRSRTFKGAQHMFYMAPEGWKLETNEIQIDMYSMGLILFELASLEYPYELPSRHSGGDALRDMHLFQEPKSLRQLRSDLPVGFYHLVSRLIEKRPQNRYSNWDEAKEALKKAWDSSESGKANDGSSQITSLLEQAEELHQVETSKTLEQAKRAAARREERRLDAYQEDKLMEQLRNLVGEFNDRSSLGQIREQAGPVFVLPYGNEPGVSSIHFEFFEVEPPLNLKRGEVRFAATLLDSGHPRLNYLLCRRDKDDLYGEWIVCEARNRSTVDPNERRSTPFERFGFPSYDIHEIEKSEGRMHVYEVAFNDDPGESFLRVISESMNR